MRVHVLRSGTVAIHARDLVNYNHCRGGLRPKKHTLVVARACSESDANPRRAAAPWESAEQERTATASEARRPVVIEPAARTFVTKHRILAGEFTEFLKKKY